MAPGISALDLERIRDASFKRAKDIQLPVGGAFKGHSDSRSVDMFLQEPYYLELPLDTSVRGVIMGMVETNLKDCGLDGYEALRARVKAIEVALRTRFDSINSHRILADNIILVKTLLSFIYGFNKSVTLIHGSVVRSSKMLMWLRDSLERYLRTMLLLQEEKNSVDGENVLTEMSMLSYEVAFGIYRQSEDYLMKMSSFDWSVEL
ncbi:hypothetical protein FOL47_004391 [Perkinsus chesapeaki]|uniref:Uncharacterized protein n=1 Tax=Perkinsus chesapeaki TaxID=330153 RepID=A0A7J6MZ50_PERCH|nr:hypothetical protein FOL47_004391 [Perkinsus chesapeaki]